MYNRRQYALTAKQKKRVELMKKRASLRNEAKPFMRQIVDRFNLRKALADDGTNHRLRMAGYRGQAPLVIFLFARLVFPLIFFAFALFYVFTVAQIEQPPTIKILICVVVAGIGFYLPNLYVSNIISKRQTSIRRACIRRPRLERSTSRRWVSPTRSIGSWPTPSSCAEPSCGASSAGSPRPPHCRCRATATR